MTQKYSLYIYPLLTVLLILQFIYPGLAEAGIYNANSEVTYKEYWVSHSEFTAGCGTHAVPGNSWYLEPWGCDKTLDFDIPDDFSQALRVEIYLDLWRNRVTPSASFRLNNGPLRTPNVGYDWSRTPYVAEIPKSDLRQGANTITFPNVTAAYHVHDIAFRIYYDQNNPLLPGSGSDVTPPTGVLTSIVAANGTFLPGAGGSLQVDNNQITLNATASEAKFVEFHALYYGYDEDNNGQFTDWHNLGRNNYHPGGTSPKSQGGTINHLGTDTSSPYRITWNMAHIINQSGVKFKIRVVDAAGNVREAAGGVSANFTLARNVSDQAYLISNFRDAVLYHGGSDPTVITRTITLPSNISNIDKAYMIGAYWQNPFISLNGNTQFKAFTSSEDVWALSVRELNLAHLKGGQNRIEYIYNPDQISFGQFIERPGPMIVLRQRASSVLPYVYGHAPAPGAVNVSPATNIAIHVADSTEGVNSNSIVMRVKGATVTPAITGSPSDYTLTYDPPTNFAAGEIVTTTVDACDLATTPNCMARHVYTFTVRSSPTINVWHGANQTFGQPGKPQEWVNILGNAADPDGLKSLIYSLNGGPTSTLSIGPDTRRLASPGDFNAEIAYTSLISGQNQVVITGTDNYNNVAATTVTVQYQSGHTWPLPYTIDWSSVATISQVAQIVDGLWTKEADSIRPTVLDYDRLVAVGDMTWSDYEVTVPITIHSLDTSGYAAPSYGPGVGLLMRWDGHDDWGGGAQPRIGWYPLGALGWYRWLNNGAQERLMMVGGNDGATLAQDTSGKTLSLGVPYTFKMRVQTTLGVGGLYKLKVWPSGQPEPAAWDLSVQEQLTDPQNGSLVLVAHHADASFGDVTITPISSGPDTTPPVITNIQVTPGQTWAVIRWTTNEPATSKVDYGLTAAYGNTVSDGALVTQHVMTLTNLVSQTLYHYQLTSADASSNSASSSDLTFTTTTSNIVSDDFNKPTLNTGLWTFINPLGDVSPPAISGVNTPDAWVSMSVPAGVAHDVWSGGNKAPRIMQPAANTDFEVEVKFERPLTATYQMQGIIVEQDSNNYLRLNFHSNGPNTYLFAASFSGGSPTTRINSIITGTNVVPLYLRLKREINQWSVSYSFNGQNWINGGSFSHPLTVASVGAFVGNVGSGGNPAPGYTGSIDYFFNTAAPIVPEDSPAFGNDDNNIYLPLILR